MCALTFVNCETNVILSPQNDSTSRSISRPDPSKNAADGTNFRAAIGAACVPHEIVGRECDLLPGISTNSIRNLRVDLT